MYISPIGAHRLSDWSASNIRSERRKTYIKMWAVQGFEPWTSPTQTENHTTRPNGQLTFSPKSSRDRFSFFLLAQNTTPVGLEPTIFGSEDQRLIHWATGPTCEQRPGRFEIVCLSRVPLKNWTCRGLNPRPSACKADVIPLHHKPYADGRDTFTFPAFLRIFPQKKIVYTSRFVRVILAQGPC